MALIDIPQYRSELAEIRKSLLAAGDALHIDHIREQLDELTEEMNQPEFWNDPDHSAKVNQKVSNLKGKLEHYEKLLSSADDIEVMLEMAEEEKDEDTVTEAVNELATLKEHTDALELETLMRGDYDDNDAVLSLHAGAGGTEAQDWTEMLFRMYTRWGELHGFNVKTLDYLEGGDAGLKSASIIVEGENAYGYLKSESGVHRLVRVSPFDASGSRHTSFSAIDVMPEMDDSINVEINPADIEMQVYRSSGAGGQHINKTSSAVRLIHKPTGIVTSCQTQRSQFQNRDYAMKMLVAKLVEIKEREHLEKIDDIKGVQKEIAWGAQIRSYVFMPYTLVKDHRTGYETANVNAVMDGNIDGFINAYLKSLSLGNLNEEDRKD